MATSVSRFLFLITLADVCTVSGSSLGRNTPMGKRSQLAAAVAVSSASAMIALA